MLFHLVQVFKGHDDFADELSMCLIITSTRVAYAWYRLVSLDPPLPVYLFNVVASLKEKSAKGYPVKKVRLTDVSKINHRRGMALNLNHF